MSKKTPFILLKRFLIWCRETLKGTKIKLLPQSLFYRFILIILLPLIFLQTVMFFFFYDRHWQTVSRRLATDVAGEIQVIADFVSANSSEQETGAFIKIAQNAFGLKINYAENQMIPSQSVNTKNSSVDHLSYELKALNYPVYMGEVFQKQLNVLVQLPSGVLTVSIPQKRFYSSTVLVFLGWTIGSSVLLFLIAFLFMKNQVRSIEKLARASELFGIGQDIMFKPAGAAEVKRAGLAFLLMRDRILKYLSERTTMLAGVSHDLRTPLTRMKLQLSMMPKDETTRDLTEDVDEMEKMLNGYLSFARGEGKETPELFLLDELISQLVEKQRKIEQDISLHIEESVSITGRLNDLSRAINNILTNAARYAKKTKVTLGIRNKKAFLMFDDNGPGIPKEKRDDVFRAFYRLEVSRNKATGGIGLGLTITRDIILSHGGEISLAESPLGGLRVLIYLPLSGLETPQPDKE
ncbi:MAG: two-component sensor histidine kinase [Alphaproteobacteria bacterium]|nr:two-component sensor histidine kinase [Alphaproteobacteria bacterium]